MRGATPLDGAYFCDDEGRRVDLGGEGGGNICRCLTARLGDDGLLGPDLYFAGSFDDSDVKLDCERRRGRSALPNEERHETELLTSPPAPKKKSPSPLLFLLLAIELPLPLLNPLSTSRRSALRVLLFCALAFFSTPSSLFRRTASCGVTVRPERSASTEAFEGG